MCECECTRIYRVREFFLFLLCAPSANGSLVDVSAILVLANISRIVSARGIRLNPESWLLHIGFAIISGRRRRKSTDDVSDMETLLFGERRTREPIKHMVMKISRTDGRTGAGFQTQRQPCVRRFRAKQFVRANPGIRALPLHTHINH